MKTSSATHHSFNWSHAGVDYIVEFAYCAPFAGARESGTGLALEPDGGDEVEVTSVMTGERFLSYAESRALNPRLECACWDYMHSLTV